MKKTLLTLVILSLSFFMVNAQHFVPLKLSISPDEFAMAGYGGFSMDKGNAPSFMEGMSNSAQSGFIVNGLYLKRGSSIRQMYSQFLVDVNPIIINWDPFTWNKFISHPVDSVFNVNKMPFNEYSLLHIGWHENILNKIRRTQNKDEYTLTRFFADIYFSPYSVDRKLDSSTVNYRFSVYNISTGAQFAYVQKEVPVLGNFLIGFSAQLNFMLVNEQDANLNNFTTLTGYGDKQFWGPGGKLTVQTNYLNIYIEGRQYYGMHTGEKFTSDPIILVGAFGNIHFLTHKKGSSNNNNNGNNNSDGNWN